MALLNNAQPATRRRGAAQPPRSRAFFLELIINVVIFALCAVVVLQVFVEAKLSTDESAALTTLTLHAETLAETYKVFDGELDALMLFAASEEVRGELTDKGALVFYYNSALELSSADDARYRLVLSPSEPSVSDAQGSLVNAVEIAGYATDQELFRFETTQYQPQGGN